MKLITRAQELGKKAAELSQAVHALPAKAAQIREAVTMTGGELKQLRSDVQSSMHALRADSEDRLLGSMREINDHARVFEEAGYDLNGMDLDLTLNQRLAVRLDKFEDVPESTLRTLLSRQSSETIRSIVNGIIKAEETAANVELSHLVYQGLIIHIGVMPMVRMCWRDVAPKPEVPHVTVAPSVASPTAPPAVSQNTSMFELRPMPTGAARAESKPAHSPALPATAPERATSSGSSWSHDALARFKQMPGTSKYGR